MTNNILPITATFLDEISHDINHQNWGEKEWNTDFAAMKEIGIDTVIMIRCGYQKWITYPSNILMEEENCHEPIEDKVAMFLRLSEKYELNFYFGIYDSGKYWVNGAYEKEAALNLKIISEVYEKYGSSPAFSGWYLSHEINRNIPGIVDQYVKLGNYCKAKTGLKVLISPYIDGKKALYASDSALIKDNVITLEQHEEDWNAILNQVKDSIDIIAFQDGHVDYHELPYYLEVNKRLCDKYDIQCWTNCESFDRDMPIKFLPIKWDKMAMKLQMAKQANFDKAITFEFSHFMSPNSSYPQARNLFNRYRDQLEKQKIGIISNS